jgi:hypothetical protein
MENNYSDAEKLLRDGEYEQFFRMMDGEKDDRDDYQFLSLQESRINRAMKKNKFGTLSSDNHDVALNNINVALFDWLYGKFVNTNSAFFVKPEKLITGKIKSILWLEKGIEKSKIVCRISIGPSYGTGTIINNKYLLTCHHVITSIEDATDARLQFNYVEGSRADEIPEYALNPSAFFYTDESLDFTICAIGENLVKYVSGNAPITLKKQSLKFVKDVQIIQHPDGQFMQIALIDSRLTGTEDHHIYYTSDTESGSSGSPVFNEKWEVIGIHTSATDKDANAGTFINYILKKLEEEKIIL